MSDERLLTIIRDLSATLGAVVAILIDRKLATVAELEAVKSLTASEFDRQVEAVKNQHLRELAKKFEGMVTP